MEEKEVKRIKEESKKNIFNSVYYYFNIFFNTYKMPSTKLNVPDCVTPPTNNKI